MKTYRHGQCDLCKWICLGSCCQIDSSEWIAWSSCQADSSKGVSSSACSLTAAQTPCALWANDPSCLHYFFGGFGKSFSLNRLLARPRQGQPVNPRYDKTQLARRAIPRHHQKGRLLSAVARCPSSWLPVPSDQWVFWTCRRTSLSVKSR